jgi:F0F1-type ATP synthase membrane subunit a
LLHLFTSLCLVPVFALPVLIGAPITMIVACVLMALSVLETLVVVLQSGVFCLLTSFYLNEVLAKKEKLGFANSKKKN